MKISNGNRQGIGLGGRADACLRLAGALLACALALALPAIARADDWQTPLVDGFDGSDFAPAGGLYYRDNFEQSAGTVEFQGDVTETGTGALRLSVKPICGAAKDGCSERAEIWERTALRVPYDKAIWYGFAVKFADPVPQDDHRYLIAQWKREIGPDAVGDFSPFLALRLNKGRLFATVETNFLPGSTALPEGNPARCKDGQTPVWLRPETNQMRALVATDSTWKTDADDVFTACTDKISVIDRGNPLPLAASGWMDFAILTQPGPGGDGHIEIFANGKWIVSIRGHIGHGDAGLEKNQYFKFGPYRAAADDLWALYYDDFRRAPDCETVLRDAAACAAIE